MVFDAGGFTLSDAISVVQVGAALVVFPLLAKLDALKKSNDGLSASINDLRVMIHRDFVSYEALERLEKETPARARRGAHNVG